MQNDLHSQKTLPFYGTSHSKTNNALKTARYRETNEHTRKHSNTELSFLLAQQSEDGRHRRL